MLQLGFSSIHNLAQCRLNSFSHSLYFSFSFSVKGHLRFLNRSPKVFCSVEFMISQIGCLSIRKFTSLISFSTSLYRVSLLSLSTGVLLLMAESLPGPFVSSPTAWDFSRIAADSDLLWTDRLSDLKGSIPDAHVWMATKIIYVYSKQWQWLFLCSILYLNADDDTPAG